MIKSPIKVEKDQLKLDIELLRYEMIQIGIKEGLTSARTIQASKKLDQYIAKYQSQINHSSTNSCPQPHKGKAHRFFPRLLKDL